MFPPAAATCDSLAARSRHSLGAARCWRSPRLRGPLATAWAAFAVLSIDGLREEIAARQHRHAGMPRRRVCQVRLVVRDAEHLPARLAHIAHARQQSVA